MHDDGDWDTEVAETLLDALVFGTWAPVTYMVLSAAAISLFLWHCWS